jgi:type II secretory pathway component PulF
MTNRPPSAAQARWWTTQLACLLGAGVPLLVALEAMHADSGWRKPQPWLRPIMQQVQRGMPLSAALGQYPRVFDATYLGTIRGAEASGAMAHALNRLAERDQQRLRWRRQLGAAMAYPLLLLVASGLSLWFMTQWVIPDLAAEFSAQGRALPPLTQMVIALSQALRVITPYLLLVLPLLAVWLWRRQRMHGDHAAATSPGLWLLWHLWGLRHLGRCVAMAEWAHTLATLLEAGVPLLQALRLTGQNAPQRPLRAATARVAQRVAQGSPCHQALARETVFAATLIQMVKLGEQTGRLAHVLGQCANLLSQQYQSTLQRLCRVLEPTLVLLMSAMVATLVLAMYLPLFDLGNLLQ